MSDKPEKIFLRKLTHFDMLCSVWGKKRVRDTDIEYIRADLAKPSEWISVDDRLPEIYKICLIGRDIGNVCSMPGYYDGEKFMAIGLAYAQPAVEITLWQPLPSPHRETP